MSNGFLLISFHAILLYQDFRNESGDPWPSFKQESYPTCYITKSKDTHLVLGHTKEKQRCFNYHQFFVVIFQLIDDWAAGFVVLEAFF